MNLAKTCLASISLAVFLGGSNLLTAQQDIIVDAAGGGDYTELQAAVDAAPVGATIRVRHGRYTGFHINKGLRLLGDPRGAGTEDVVEIAAEWTVSGIPRGQALVLTDLAGYSEVRIEDSKGEVFLGFVSAFSSVVNCDFVAFDRCFGSASVQSSNTTHTRCELWGLTGLHARDSRVVLVSSSVTSVIGIFGAGQEPAVLEDSHLIHSPDTTFTPFCDVRTGYCPAPIRSTRSVVSEMNRALISVDDSSRPDQISVSVDELSPSAHLYLGASLGQEPWLVPQGHVYLDPESVQNLYLGLLPTGSSAQRLILLPADYQPNYRMRAGIEDPAPAGSRALGLPITFQAALIRTGDLFLSMPYTVIY